jgi:hypothetical protein
MIMTIDRNQLIQESILREYIRKQLIVKAQKRLDEESQLRGAIRKLIKEEVEGDQPYESTGINVLKDVLKKIIPILEDGYKMLTTDPEQRQSFRNHIIQAVKASLATPQSLEKTEEAYEVDADTLLEKITIEMGDEDGEEIEGEFLDVFDEEGEATGEDTRDMSDTGRNFADDTYNKIESQIVDAYEMLGDETDKELFYDYLLTNLLLYFDKFEDELQVDLPDVTTPEYEEEKAEDDIEDTDFSADL